MTIFRRTDSLSPSSDNNQWSFLLINPRDLLFRFAASFASWFALLTETCRDVEGLVPPEEVHFCSKEPKRGLLQLQLRLLLTYMYCPYCPQSRIIIASFNRIRHPATLVVCCIRTATTVCCTFVTTAASFLSSRLTVSLGPEQLIFEHIQGITSSTCSRSISLTKPNEQ